MGHGEVRFCAYCTLSWDQTEDGSSLLEQRTTAVKTVIAYDDGIEGGELPEDITGRMAVLAGAIYEVMGFERRLQEMMKIPESLFTLEAMRKPTSGELDEVNKIVAEIKALWPDMVREFSRVMALVHLSMRMLPVDVDALYDELYKARVIEFEAVVSDFVAQMDCGGQAKLLAGSELDAINEQSRLDAEMIASTYNRDLARVIDLIRVEVPTANRHTYAKHLREWEAGRSAWKTAQIALHTTMTARELALKSFVEHNALAPNMELMPRLAKEPICAGWINRGRVPWSVAKANPSPYHIGCIHYWQPVDFPKVDCSELWTGSV